VVHHSHGTSHTDQVVDNTLPQENSGNGIQMNGDCEVCEVSMVSTEAQGSDCWECGAGGEVDEESTRRNVVVVGVLLHCQSLPVIQLVRITVEQGRGWEHRFQASVDERGVLSSASWKSGLNRTKILSPRVVADDLLDWQFSMEQGMDSMFHPQDELLHFAEP